MNNEANVIIASCGDQGIALMTLATETLLSEKGALVVTEELVRCLSKESLQQLGPLVMERLNEGLGHESETMQ
jgi:hypothetical protein